ncbi:carboxypeptidase-like regulatory domain-containing protein [Pedobacter antarcticus]|uniref:carboxypeptidase-like regulatory domain-containing protein n=1 Tax=Pedobacter antarcticus TaxID=34086 RepID=UPI001C58D310|nr:carboxypeptidase-like regulatory domain-containing protein [Pedobacter antarcticus]
MRLFILFFFVFLSNQVFSQYLTGLVIDEATRKPIKNARVATSSNATYTTSTGSFVLNHFHSGDTITVSYLGYEAYHIRHSNRSKTDTLLILLKSNSIVLLEVRVKGIRNYTRDSLNKRKEYAAFYAYKAPKFKDIFITKSLNVSTQYSPFQNSTSSLVGVNLLSVISLLSKNNVPVSKMQKQLLKDEEYNYVDHVFSKEKVQSLTSLKGDSLQNFMNEYRPSIKELKQMTDYQLILYIKKSYDTFNKTYKHEISPFLKK